MSPSPKEKAAPGFRACPPPVFSCRNARPISIREEHRSAHLMAGHNLKATSSLMAYNQLRHNSFSFAIFLVGFSGWTSAKETEKYEISIKFLPLPVSCVCVCA